MSKAKKISPSLTAVVVDTTPGWKASADRLSASLRGTICALGPLEWEDKRKVLLWACDVFGINATQLGSNR